MTATTKQRAVASSSSSSHCCPTSSSTSSTTTKQSLLCFTATTPPSVFFPSQTHSLSPRCHYASNFSTFISSSSTAISMPPPHARPVHPSSFRRRRVITPTCLIPPKRYQLPLSDHEKGPPGYKWDPDFPGTLKPGTVEDNFPLQRVLDSDVYNNMIYDEFDMDERVAEIVDPDEDLLDWLHKNNRLIPRDADTDDYDLGNDPMTSLTEDDLDYADDDTKMIEYYSKQSEGTQTGTSLDFGGFSDSGSSDYDAGF